MTSKHSKNPKYSDSTCGLSLGVNGLEFRVGGGTKTSPAAWNKLQNHLPNTIRAHDIITLLNIPYTLMQLDSVFKVAKKNHCYEISAENRI